MLVNCESIALFVAGVELYLPPLAFCHYNIVCILPRPASLNSSTFPYILLNPDIQKVCMQVKFFKQSPDFSSQRVLDEAHLKVAVRAMARLHALSLVHLAK